MAIAEITKRLPPPAEPCADSACRISHSAVAEGTVRRDHVTLEVVLYASVQGDGGGHSTRVQISLAEFRGSRLVRTQVHFTEAGTYGRPFEAGERYVIVPLNDSEYAVVIEDHDLRFGEATDFLSVFIVAKDGAVLGYAADAGVDTSDWSPGPSTNWRTAWTLIDVPGGRPELFLARRGVNEGRVVDAVERRRWNGTGFIPVPLASPEGRPGAAEVAASGAAAPPDKQD